MKYLKNKNIKYLILPMVILTIVTSILITIQTYNQYKKVTITANKKIADIIGIMMQQEPEIDTRKIRKWKIWNWYKWNKFYIISTKTNETKFNIKYYINNNI